MGTTDAQTFSRTAEFLAQIVEHVGHPIFVKGRDFRYVLVNNALCEMVGIAREAILGKTDFELFPQPEAEFFRLKDEEMFRTGRSVVIEEETITDAYGVRHVLATIKAPLRAPNGDATHVVGIIHDITRIKAAEDALRVANEELERRVEERSRALAQAQGDLMRKERLAVLGRLAGGVAHQIRNPLGAIKNAAYVVQRTLGERADEQTGKALEVIHDEVQRANRIITDLLDYARVRAPERRAVRVGYLVEQALGAQDLPASVHLARRISESERVMVDAAQVQSALSNVLRNAVEAMPRGGELRVESERVERGVSLRVTDTGTGVADEVRTRLFEPLITTKPLGLGLGLVTAKTLIEGQGGEIACVESSTSGTTFEIVLPAAD